MDVSPCQKYLLLGYEDSVFALLGKMFIRVLDLETGESVMRAGMGSIGHVNCGVWVPPSGAHGLRVCMGSKAGKIFMYSANS